MSAGEEHKSSDVRTVITSDHMKQVLRADQGPEAQLSSWLIKDFTPKGVNFVAVVTSVEVNFNLQGKEKSTSYVVKIKPNGGIFENSELYDDLFDNESRFYGDIAPALTNELKSFGLSPLNVPSCYLAESNHGLIFLEDLRSRGFQLYQGENLDQIHGALILQEVAKLHAASLLPNDKTHLKDSSSTPKAANFPNIFRGGCTLSELILKHCEGYRKAEKWAAYAKENSHHILEKYMTGGEDTFKVVLHGDCHAKNFLFRYNDGGEPVEAMLLDLQASRASHPALDLVYFMHLSLGPEGRKEYFERNLKCYYNTFTAVLEAGGKASPFTLSDLRHEYEKRQEYGTLFATVMVPLMLPIMIGEATEAGEFIMFDEERYKVLAGKVNESNFEIIKKSDIFVHWFLPLFESMKDG